MASKIAANKWKGLLRGGSRPFMMSQKLQDKMTKMETMNEIKEYGINSGRISEL